jgi:putative phosphoribosyl transferase
MRLCSIGTKEKIEKNMKIFKNRAEAGKALAKKLTRYKDRPDVLVLALKKSGLLVAEEIVKELNVILDIYLVETIKPPIKNSVSIGQVTSGGTEVLDEGIIKSLKIPKELVKVGFSLGKRRLMKRQLRIRGDRPFPDFRNKTVIITDDGISQKGEVLAVINSLKKAKSEKIVYAVPFIVHAAKQKIEPEVAKLITIAVSNYSWKTPEWYEDLSLVSEKRIDNIIEQYSDQ